MPITSIRNDNYFNGSGINTVIEKKEKHVHTVY